MKQKIAILLAAIMTFALVPAISLSAAAEVNIIGGENTWAAKTLSYSSDVDLLVDGARQTPGEVDFNIGDNDIENISNAAVLEIKEFPLDVKEFTVRLTGADFLYAKGLGSSTSGVNGYTFPTSGLGSGYYFDEAAATYDRYGVTNELKAYHTSDPTRLLYTIFAEDNELLVRVDAAYLAYLAGLATPATYYTFRIPLSMFMDAEADVKVRVTDAVDVDMRSVSGIPSGNRDVNYKTDVGSATVTPGDVVTGKDYVELEDITIKESVRGAVKPGGTIKLSLTSGFMFDIKHMNLEWQQRFGNTVTPNYFFEKDDEVMYIKIPAITDTSSARTFYIKGLAVTNTDDNDEPSGNVTLTVKGDYDVTKVNVTNYNTGSVAVTAFDSGATTSSTKGSFIAYKAGIKSTSFVVATFNDYAVDLAFMSGSFAKAWSGETEIEIDTIKISEKVKESWSSARKFSFTLVDADGVQLTGAKFYGPDTDTPTDGFDIDDDDNCTANVYFESGLERSVELSSADDTEKQWYSFNIKLNISAGYVGDVYLQASGRALSNDKITLKIAEISEPFSISARKTSVPVGKQTYSVADISVMEAAAGIFKSGGELYIGLREFLTETSSRTAGDVQFNPITASQVKVTEGDLSIGAVDSDSEYVSVKIKRESKSASTVKFSGLAIKITGSAPQGTYDLIATDYDDAYSSNAIIQSYYGSDWNSLSTSKKDDSDLFGVWGRGQTGYIAITNNISNEVLAKNVLVEIGSDKAVVDGVAVTISAPTFLDRATNRTMLPVRAIAEVFGIATENIIWSDVNRTVTLLTADRTIQFTIDSDNLLLNGTLVPMVDESGRSVSAIISDGNDGGTYGRTYVPFRQLAKALGIEVLWIPGVDGNNAMVALNPTAEDTELAEANLEIFENQSVNTLDEEVVDEEVVDEEAAAERR